MTPGRGVATVLLLGAAALAVLAGCVKETVGPSRGVPVKGARDTRQSTSGTPSAPLDGGATPATAHVTAAAVRLALQPLGTVTYDGQALPVLSPDGRFMAVQSGEAPDWPTILGEDGASLPNRTSLGVFDLSGSAMVSGSQSALPPGLMLGRNASNDGYLVESPQHDGSRWIGLVSWRSGKIAWLVQDSFVNAHGLILANGSLAYTRRDVNGARRDLCVRTGERTIVHSEPDASYAYPIAGDDPAFLVAVRQDRAGSDMQAFRLRAEELQVLYRRELLANADLLLAHQIAMTSPGPLPVPPGGVDSPLIALSPRHRRLAWLNADTGTFQPLLPRSQAAAASPDPANPGFYCTTPDALVFVARGTEASTDALAKSATVLSAPWVPRRVASLSPTLVCFGPVPGSPDRLEILRLSPAPADGGR